MPIDETKLIALTQGKFAIVDADDYDFLMQWKWWYAKGTYAARSVGGRRNKKILFMHRLILNTPEDKFTDHINGNKLDNRRKNLRHCTHQQNMSNMKNRIGGTSKYKGVYWHKGGKKWAANVTVNYKNIHLGLFVSEIEAASAYNEAALQYFKEFAKLNIIRRKAA